LVQVRLWTSDWGAFVDDFEVRAPAVSVAQALLKGPSVTVVDRCRFGGSVETVTCSKGR
jgi:hypothetical protein